MVSRSALALKTALWPGSGLNLAQSGSKFCYSLTTNVGIYGVEPISAEFLVVPCTAPPLLEKKAAQSLGILKLRINHILQ